MHGSVIQSKVRSLVVVLLVIKAQASRYYAEMSSVGTDWDAFTSAQIQHFMAGNLHIFHLNVTYLCCRHSVIP